MSVLVSSWPSIPASSICRTCRLRLVRQLRQNVSARQLSFSQPRPMATSAAPLRLANEAGQKSDDNAESLPRWASTPSAMRAPHRLRPKTDLDDFPVNEDPEKLMTAYVRVLGSEELAKSLPEHLQFLAVTHKSFDNGRRGFNDRLAFLGKRLVEMQTSLALVDRPLSTDRAAAIAEKDAFGRLPFVHQALGSAENLQEKATILTKDVLADLANSYKLGEVIRWRPRQISKLRDSGLDHILAHTLYAVAGAVALQRGGEVATQTVRKRILKPLGIL